MRDWPINSLPSPFRAVSMLSLIRRPGERHGRLTAAAAVLTLVAGVVAAGCAAATATHKGEAAEFRADYDVAVAEYTKALRLKPDDLALRSALDRARLRAGNEHFDRGRRFAAVAKYE